MGRRRLDVQPPSLYRRMERFSGGNQQKAVLARWLRTEPRVLLLDEPTQGVDVGAKASIYRHVRDGRRSAATAVLVASSDAAELAHLCDRVLVFRSGTVATELRGAALTEERLIAETFGTTSHRRTMLVKREPIRVKVIRDDRREADADGAPDAAVPTPKLDRAAAAHRRCSGRVRELLGRLPTGGRRTMKIDERDRHGDPPDRAQEAADHPTTTAVVDERVKRPKKRDQSLRHAPLTDPLADVLTRATSASSTCTA